MWTIARCAPRDRLEGAADQVLAGLHQHLDGDVVRDAVFLDQAAAGS